MEKSVQFYNLKKISSKMSSHMWTRYNRALKAACGFETKLESFHIDCSGYSPEIAEECGDPDYLNTNGANKRFIIISIDQINLPISQAYFSSTVHIIKKFMKDNYKQLILLTALDSIYGELENNIIKINNLKDVINAPNVEIKLESTKSLIAQENKLNQIIDGLRAEDNEAWLTDDKLNDIIDIVEKVGDVRKNKLKPSVLNYEMNFFYTNHFGGMYVYKKQDEIIILAKQIIINGISGAKNNRMFSEEMNISFINLDSVSEVYRFLAKEEMIVYIGLEDIIDSADEISKYIDLIAIEQMVLDDEIIYSHKNPPSSHQIKSYIAKNYHKFDKTFELFNELSCQIKRNEDIDSIDEEVIFYFVKPDVENINQENIDIINHIISNFTDYKYVENFLSNRDLFFDNYNSWPKKKQKFAETLIINSI